MAALSPAAEAEVRQLNQNLDALRRQEDQIYSKIGAQYYALRKDNPDAELAEACEEEKNVCAQMKRIETRIKFLNGIVVCSECEAENDVSVSFCVSCGARLPHKAVINDGQKHCSNCGNVIAPGHRFCGCCGAAVVEEQTPVIEESLPVIEESLPVIEESLPVVEESLPVAEETMPVVEESTICCPSCGAKITDEATVFCAECGTKVR